MFNDVKREMTNPEGMLQEGHPQRLHRLTMHTFPRTSLDGPQRVGDALSDFEV